MMRLNHLQPPFDKPAGRQALLYALDQAGMMQSYVGDDPAMYHVPHGVFCPKTPMASDEGLAPLRGPRDYARARTLLQQAGYGAAEIDQLRALGVISEG